MIRASSLGRYFGKMRSGVHLARLTQRKYNAIEEHKGLPLSGLKTRQLYIRYSYLTHTGARNIPEPFCCKVPDELPRTHPGT
jgi:hypothetical protein